MNMKRARGVAALAFAAAAAVTLVGCSSSSTPQSSTLTIPAKDPTATIHVVSPNGLTPETQDMQAVIDAFEKAHPTIKVVWQTVPFDSLSSVLDTQISNKQGLPDVYFADEPRIPALVARGEAADLTSVFGQYESQINKNAWAANTVDGKLYAAPAADSSQLLFYNKDLLAKAGVTPPSSGSPISWEDLQADAIKAAKAGATYGLAFGQPNTYYQLQPLPVQLGGSSGASGKGNLTPDITSEPWIKAMTFYQGLFSSGASSTAINGTNADSDFNAGKTAFLVDGPWELPHLQQASFNWGVAAQPVFAGGKAATPSGSGSMAMNPFSKQKDAALIFLKWFSFENGYITNRANPEMPYSPSSEEIYYAKPIFSTPQGKDAETVMKDQAHNSAINRLQTVGYIEFETIMGKAFSDIQNGGDPKTVLESATTQLNTAWAKYQH